MPNYFDIQPCGFLSFSDDGTINEVNETLCTFLNFSKEELISKKIEQIVTLATRIFFQTHLFPLLKMQLSVNEIFITLLGNNKIEVPVLLNAKRIENENGFENVCVFMPVYYRKKYEDEILEAKRKAELAIKENTELLLAKKNLQQQAEDLDSRLVIIEQSHEDVTQFNRVVTHDLQEPLRKISVFISLLLEGKKNILSTETNTLINKIAIVSEQMKKITSGLQKYVWLTDAEADKTEIDITRLLQVVKRQLATDYENEVFDLQVESMPKIYGYWDQLFLLFYQLIQNSIKYRNKEVLNTIVVSGTIVQENKFRKIKDKFKYEDYLRVEVKDNGIGFDSKYKNEIFSLFKKLYSNNGNLGLGLALCKKVMNNHSGFIEAVSQDKKGASFFCFFPLSKDDA